MARPRKGPRIHFQYESDQQRADLLIAAQAAGVDESVMIRRLIADGLTVWRWAQARKDSGGRD